MSEDGRFDLHEFRAQRRRKTDNLLKEDHRDLKRFFALDSAAYRDARGQGGLDEKTKELLGLVASTVLRCNDCIAYHCDRCAEVGWTKAELLDALNVALVVGGSITIPHIRTVWEMVEQLYEEQDQKRRAKEGAPALQRAAAEVAGNVHEHRSEAVLTQGQAPARTAAARTAAAPAAPPPRPPAKPPAAKPAAPVAARPSAPATPRPSAPAATGPAKGKPATKPAPPAHGKAPAVKPTGKPTRKSQGV